MMQRIALALLMGLTLMGQQQKVLVHGHRGARAVRRRPRRNRPSGSERECSGCDPELIGAGCVDPIGHKKQVVRVFNALRPLRVPSWPYPCPVGIRERSELHVVDGWQFLGTAARESEVHELLGEGPREFDAQMFGLLRRLLARVPRAAIVDLGRFEGSRSVGHQRVEVPRIESFSDD